ncbi:MAG: GNAT family N-acetyltransferase [Clostridiales bacterium]|nr:GNAT family N-acetyltransferase [Clostridiales bacterium]
MLRLANTGEREEILSLYRSVMGTKFCTWNEDYPSMEEIDNDIENNCLYVMTSEGRIIASISIVPERELDELQVWSEREDAAELARLVVNRDCQGKGLAFRMLSEMEELLREKGTKTVHLLAAKQNIPAVKTYLKADYEIKGEVNIYGNSYFAMEKIL